MESAHELAVRIQNILEQTSPSIQEETARELQRQLTHTFNEAMEEERAGLKATLRLCVAVLDEALSLADVPRPFRATARVCKGLCLDALGESILSEDSGDESNLSRLTLHRGE